MNFDVDGTYGSPFGSDGWSVISGDAHEAVIWCSNPADWLGFDLHLLAPEGPTSWTIRAYEGNTLKDLQLISYDGTTWTILSLGACCGPDGTVPIKTADDCMAAQGAWLGNAVECSTVGCQQTPVDGLSWGRVKSLYR